MISNGFGIGIPPRHGEVSAAYTQQVCERLSPAWHYDWRYGLVGTDGYVPMLYDGNVERLQDCANTVLAPGHELPDMVLLLNEPERADQADMTPEEAVTTLRRWWREVPSWVVPCAVGGVNVSMHYGDTPYEWLDAFVIGLKAAERPQIDKWHIHAYGPASAFVDAVRVFRMWMQERDMVRPVVMSECGTDDNPAALMMTIRAMLQDGVLERAAWFSAYYEPWNDTGLLDSEGELTEAGRAYIAQQHYTYLPAVHG